MQSNITRLIESARLLKQHLDHLHLDSQMQEPILDIFTSEYFTTEPPGSNISPASMGITEMEMEIASNGRCQACCRQGKCAFCLTTVSSL